MATSILDSLLKVVDSRTIGNIGQALGEPAQAVSRGMEPSFAALLSGLARKADDDPGALRRALETVPSTAGPVSWSQVASSVADPNSSLMAAGRRLLPALFGTGEQAVTSGISQASGMSSRATSTLLTMAAPVLMSFLGRHMRDAGMNFNGMAALLQRESGSYTNALPTGLREVFRSGAATASPVVAQTVKKERSTSWLIPVLAAAGLALCLIWLANHAHRPVTAEQVPVPSAPTGEASRLATPAPNVTCTLPAGVVLPANGAESRLMGFIQDPNAKPSADTWFNSGQLFATGSARLAPGSGTEINNIAAILTNCPNVRMTIGGYTDSVGSAGANLRLSRNRADAVVGALVSKGVSRDRLVAKGFGEQYPVADNNTTGGRAQNRRVAMNVTEK